MQDITIRIDSRWFERIFWVSLVLVLAGLLAWKWVELESLKMSDTELLEEKVGFDLDEIEKAAKIKETADLVEEKEVIIEEELNETEEEKDTREQKDLDELSGDFDIKITNAKFLSKGEDWGKVTEIVVKLVNGLSDDYNLKFKTYVYKDIEERDDNSDIITFDKLFLSGYDGIKILRPNSGKGISIRDINETKIVEVKVYDALTDKILGSAKKTYNFG